MTRNAYRVYRHVATLPTFDAVENVIEASIDIHVQALSAAARIQTEATDFVIRRWQQQVALMGDLVGSLGSNDALDVVGDFVRTAKIDYANETSKLLTMGSELASQVAHRAREEANAAFNGMAARTVA